MAEGPSNYLSCCSFSSGHLVNLLLGSLLAANLGPVLALLNKEVIWQASELLFL